VKQSDQGESGETIESAESFRRFVVGDRVCLLQSVPYLKTADPMPMLRPPDLVATGEVGAVSEIRPLDQLAVRFRRGTFLLSIQDLRPASGNE
jgi:hypothetical protein